MSDDLTLLRQYAATKDAEAFSILVRRYAGLVHGTCLRIMANEHDAEDVAQACFIELARKPESISSLPGWLHSLASSRAKDAIRSAVRRRDNEREASSHDPDDDPTWEDIAPHVDAALEELPEDLRAPLILHFLQGKNQTQVAAELGVDQSTVSRRLDTGIDELRRKLQKAGIVASVALLTNVLTANAASVVPATLMTSLGKMALAGVSKGTGATAVTGLLGTTAAKVAAVVVAGAVVIGGAAIQFAPAPTEEPIPTTETSARSPSELRYPLSAQDTNVLNALQLRLPSPDDVNGLVKTTWSEDVGAMTEAEVIELARLYTGFEDGQKDGSERIHVAARHVKMSDPAMTFLGAASQSVWEVTFDGISFARPKGADARLVTLNVSKISILIDGRDGTCLKIFSPSAQKIGYRKSESQSMRSLNVPPMINFKRAMEIAFATFGSSAAPAKVAAYLCLLSEPQIGIKDQPRWTITLEGISTPRPGGWFASKTWVHVDAKTGAIMARGYRGKIGTARPGMRRSKRSLPSGTT